MLAAYNNSVSDFRYWINNERQTDFVIFGKRAIIFKEMNSDISFFNYFLFRLFTINYRTLFFKENKARLNLRAEQLKGSYLFFKKDKLKNNKHTTLKRGLVFFWKALQYWLLSLFLAGLCLYYLTVIKLLPFGKTIFSWIMAGMFFYWLISGFVFFTKRYKYSKFTSAIQRFWRRSYIIFWLIESSLFVVFLYLTLNSSAEPFIFYDPVSFYKQHLFSWRSFFYKNMLIIVLIIFSYFTLLLTKWSHFSKLQACLLPITLLVVYIAWLETYQIYHILHFYGTMNWVYDADERLWNLEAELRRTRILNHYVTICFIAKYFHVVFILVFWVFFVLRTLEQKRVYYPLLSANIQNFLFLYIMNWIYMYPWFKFFFRRYLEYSSVSTNLTTHNLGFKVFFSDLGLYLTVIFESSAFTFKENLIFFEDMLFYYWSENTVVVRNSQFVRHAIRDLVVNYLS